MRALQAVSSGDAKVREIVIPHGMWRPYCEEEAARKNRMREWAGEIVSEEVGRVVRWYTNGVFFVEGWLGY